MKQLLLIDEQNYDPSLQVHLRIAVRGVIFDGERVLVIRTKKGEAKLPGGGKQAGESDLQTLMREVFEETGYRVLPESVVPFGQIEEKRLAREGNYIWHQINRYYTCQVDMDHPGTPVLSDYEVLRAYRADFLTPMQALACERALLQREAIHPYSRREICIYEQLLLENLPDTAENG